MYLMCSYCGPDKGTSYACLFVTYIQMVCKIEHYIHTYINVYIYTDTVRRGTHIVHYLATDLVLPYLYIRTFHSRI
jgi:hypothetical protein